MKKNTIVFSQLSLERCRHYIAHIHALMYMNETDKQGIDPATSHNIQAIVMLLDQELQENQKLLRSTKSKSPSGSRKRVAPSNICAFPAQTSVTNL